MIGAIVKIRSQEDDDKSQEEIYNYQEARCVSVCEACYRILSFELHGNVPHIVRFALHLENAQTVSFKEIANVNSV